MSMDDLMQKDQEARQRIVEKIDSNFFVEAGAGSGKTTILVERMVSMVEQGVDVRHICAITFTKAAAGEFYDRFQKRLIQRSLAPTEENFDPQPGKLGNPTNETRKRCMDALNNLDLCFMGTIDAFCNMILSEHPAKAGIPSSATLLSKEDMNAQYKRIYSQIKNGQHGTQLRQLCQRFCGIHGRPDSTFVDSIGKIMEKRNCKFCYDAVADGTVDTLLKDEKAVLLSVLKTLLSHPELKFNGEKRNEAAWEALPEKEKRLRKASWQDDFNQVYYGLKDLKNLRLAETADLSLFGPVGQGMFAPHFSRNKLSWYQFDESGINPLLEKMDEIKYRISMAFLTAAADTVADVLREEGKLTYFDYLLYLRDTLKEDAEKYGGTLIRHIYGRHKYFLIDEFQDTNPMQAEVFFYLTAQNIQADWRKCLPHPGSLFIVGDPKQSIYRFRYADISAFARIRKLFEEGAGEVVELTRNFRSTYKLRKWFNSTFQTLFPKETDDYQSKFEPIPLEAEPISDGMFEGGVYSYQVRMDSKAPDEEKAPEKTAKIIQKLVGNPAYRIRTKKNDSLHPLNYEDIMLILPRKTKMGEYIKTFVRYNIPFRVEGEVLFSECPALVATSRVFSAVADPGCLQKLIGALTCRRFGFDLNAIHHMKNMGVELSLLKEPPEEQPIGKAMEQLKALVDRSAHLSATALLYHILETLQIFRYTGADNLEYVYFAAELLRSAENSGQFGSLTQAAAYLETLIADQSEEERTVRLSEDQNCVHIANLHKVKGLEAPVVILGDPYKKDYAPDTHVVQKDDRPQPECWLFSATKRIGEITLTLFSAPGYQNQKEEEARFQEAEKQRLLYVAATRAQRLLIVADARTATGKSSNENPWEFFRNYCDDGDFFDLPVGTVATAPEKEEKKAGELYADAQNLLRNPLSQTPGYTIRRPSEIKLKGKTSPENDMEDAGAERTKTEESTRKNGALMGTLVHSLMEVLVSSRNTVSLPELVEGLVCEYDADTESNRQMLTKVGTTIQNGGFAQTLGAPQDVLKTLLEADEVYCEVPFCRKAGTEIWHGIMDVVYRMGNQWYILDYKTNQDGSMLDVQYKDQLDAYIEAFRDLTGHTAKALLYHIKL